MAWKYSFGYKLSAVGKQRLIDAVEKLGYQVVDVGWDSIILATRLSASDRDYMLSNLNKILIAEKQES